MFEIKVTTYNGTEGSHKIYDMLEAASLAIDFGTCENVATVDCIDCATGEVILTIKNQKLTWLTGIGEI
ncbi:MAG: hypothetical protein PHQ86_05465 [Dehalococcoidales bacterium]|nr:hypothetical protein [Dehalococcoidales bacterium]